jgi:hypothetical protein
VPVRWSNRGVTHVLSILDPDRPDPEIFWAYDPIIGPRCAIEPGPDLMLPQPEHVEAILNFGRSLTAKANRFLAARCECIAGQRQAIPAALASGHGRETLRAKYL